jgi:predicted TIM-barrel fold metal-dependent hydrolase
MTYALDTLKLDGVGFLASVDGKYLGDPDLDPIFAELNRRKAVVFVHPNDPPPDRATGLDFPGTLTEFVFDTTRAAANLIFSGTLERYPDVRIILAHAGGTVPFLAWRLSLGDTSPKLREKAPQGVLAYLRRFYYETALSANPFALSSLQELADPSRIVFGSERENALALFPRLAGVTVRS